MLCEFLLAGPIYSDPDECFCSDIKSPWFPHLSSVGFVIEQCCIYHIIRILVKPIANQLEFEKFLVLVRLESVLVEGLKMNFIRLHDSFLLWLACSRVYDFIFFSMIGPIYSGFVSLHCEEFLSMQLFLSSLDGAGGERHILKKRGHALLKLNCRQWQGLVVATSRWQCGHQPQWHDGLFLDGPLIINAFQSNKFGWNSVFCVKC